MEKLPRSGRGVRRVGHVPPALCGLKRITKLTFEETRLRKLTASPSFEEYFKFPMIDPIQGRPSRLSQIITPRVDEVNFRDSQDWTVHDGPLPSIAWIREIPAAVPDTFESVGVPGCAHRTDDPWGVPSVTTGWGIGVQGRPTIPQTRSSARSGRRPITGRNRISGISPCCPRR